MKWFSLLLVLFLSQAASATSCTFYFNQATQENYVYITDVSNIDDVVYMWGTNSYCEISVNNVTYTKTWTNGKPVKVWLSLSGGTNMFLYMDADECFPSVQPRFDYYGGGGEDVVMTGHQNDFVNTWWGPSTISTGDGTDTIWAGVGNDTILSGPGIDEVNDNGGYDKLNQGGGDGDIRFGHFEEISNPWEI